VEKDKDEDESHWIGGAQAEELAVEEHLML
jgi:hypothetical protein